MKPDKKSLVVSAGAGLGVIQTIYTKELGLFPVIGDYLPPPWGKWSTIGNILIGGIVFGLTTFTNILNKSHNYINTALQVYGLTTLVGGLANGVFETSLGLSGRGAALSAYGQLAGGNGFFTSDYYNAPQGNFYRRPQSPAKGFGSDITKNPMAAIPTTIPYNKIIS